jgi:hypothetical protein
MLETGAAQAAQQLVNYGAVGICLVICILAIVYLDKDRTKIRKELADEQRARVEDAKAYMDLALELQQREQGKIDKLDTIAEILKAKARGGGGE